MTDAAVVVGLALAAVVLFAGGYIVGTVRQARIAAEQLLLQQQRFSAEVDVASLLATLKERTFYLRGYLHKFGDQAP